MNYTAVELRTCLRLLTIAMTEAALEPCNPSFLPAGRMVSGIPRGVSMDTSHPGQNGWGVSSTPSLPPDAFRGLERPRWRGALLPQQILCCHQSDIAPLACPIDSLKAEMFGFICTVFLFEMVDSLLKVSTQRAAAVKKASSKFGII